MSEKQSITEEMNIHEQWYKQAENMTLEELPEFINKLMNDYNHDYGTVCHAFASGAVATLWAMNNHSQGGITGFQSGFIMWEFIKNWLYTNNKTSLKLVDYDKMLYPQYSHAFEKTINKKTWENIKKEAQNLIEKADKEYKEYLIKLDQYKNDLAAFIEKYPNYYNNKEYYDRIGIGTSKDWEIQRLKEESGFEFAPSEPYKPLNEDSRVYRHWKSIVDGKVPFGYVVVEN